MTETYRPLYNETMKAIDEMVEEYNAQELGVPDRVRVKAQAILGATTDEEAWAAAKKAKSSAMISFLSAWANKRIPGKITEQNVEGRAKRAENLADHLDKIGQPEQAAKQRQRAVELRAMVQQAQEGA